MRRMLGEYADATELVRGVEILRRRRYTRIEAYTPYPVHELDHALDAPPSRLPRAIFAIAVAAAGAAYALQWLLNAYLYPLDVGGRPPHYPLSFVPITFEMGILAAALTAFVGVLVLGRLVRLYDPVFDAPGFESATKDRFWLEITADDPLFDPELTAADLREAGATAVVTVGGAP